MKPVVRTHVTPPSPENSSVRCVVLPSGKEIEVVRFDAPGATPSPPRALHVCPECAGDHMQPVDWQDAGRDHWELELRCPNEALVADLRRLRQARMEDDVERFSRALTGDQHPA